MIAVLSSVTTATRVKQFLEKQGEHVRMIQTPKALSQGGCGYSVVFRDELMEQVEQAVRRFGASVRGYYQEVSDGEERKYVSVLRES